MNLKAKLIIYTFVIIFVFSLIILISVSILFSKEINNLNSSLYDEKINKLIKLAMDQDDLFFEGLYIDENEPKERMIDKMKLSFTELNGSLIYPFIIDSTGLVVTHPILKRNDDSLKDSTFVKDALSKRNGELYYTYNNEFKWMKYKTFEPWGWTFFYTVPVKIKNSAINSFLIFEIIATILCLIIFIVSGYIFIINSLNPLKLLTGKFKEISSGEGDLTQRVGIKTKDEVGNLSISFDIFIGKLHSIISKLKDVCNKTKGIGLNLATNTEEVSSTAEEMLCTMRSISGQIEILNNENRKSNESIRDINSLTDKIVKIIDSQSAAVSQSSSSITQMISAIYNIEKATESKKEFIDKLVDLARKGQIDMDNNVRIINDISKSADDIINMIKMINDIASQTNLLSMNAAIEAAHAGDAEKGFSVVAEEIRNLATSTTSNSKNISVTVKGIIEKIKNASEVSMSTNKSIQEIISGIIDVSGSMSETLTGIKEISVGSKEIIDSLTILVAITEDVKVLSKEINNKVFLIEDSMKRIQTLSDENRNGIFEMTSGMSQISNSTNMIANLSNNNSRNIDLIEEEVMRFTK